MSSVRNWWISLLLGILFVIAALWMMVAPVATYEALVLFVSVFMFVSGLFEIAFAASNSKRLHGWGWYLIGGIIDLLLGAYLISHPGLTAIIIPYIIAFWLMFRGFSTMGFSFDLSGMGVKGWGWYLTLGILAVISAIFIIWSPFTGAFLAVYMTAFSFLFIGIFRISLALKLKKIGEHIQP